MLGTRGHTAWRGHDCHTQSLAASKQGPLKRRRGRRRSAKPSRVIHRTGSALFARAAIAAGEAVAGKRRGRKPRKTT